MQHKGKPMRMTRGCNMVLRYLKNARGLHSAHEIYGCLRNEFDSDAPGLTTVYRSLETLLKFELIQAIELGQGEKSFEFVEPGEHHHHVICTSCNASVHMDDCFVESMSKKIQDHHGFEVRAHIMELFGLCPTCKSSARQRTRTT